MLNDDQRSALRTVSEVLIEIRRAAKLGAPAHTIAALADAVHNTPRLIAEDNQAMSWLVRDERERVSLLLQVLLGLGILVAAPFLRALLINL